MKESKHLATHHLLHSLHVCFLVAHLLLFPFDTFNLSPFFPHFQHTILDLDLDLAFLDLLQYPGLFPLSIFIPLVSAVKALPDVSLELFHCISSLRIAPTTSSNFKVPNLETELLMAINNHSNFLTMSTKITEP